MKEKLSILIWGLIFLYSCNSKSGTKVELHFLSNNPITQTEARTFIEFIDSTTDMLGSPAMNLVRYFNKVRTISKSKSDFILQQNQIDSLDYYYNNVIATYDNAIFCTNNREKFRETESIKQNFLMILMNGKEAWTSVIPSHLKAFRTGLSSVTGSERNIIDSTSSILLKSATTVLQCSAVTATQMEEFEKIHHIDSVNSKPE